MANLWVHSAVSGAGPEHEVVIPRGPVVMVVLAWALSGCGRTVSCETDLGMCHEWVDASPGLRREIEEAVCRKRDERFAERPCPRAGVVGVCELAGGRERTLWYARGGAGDPAAICRDSGGTFSAK